MKPKEKAEQIFFKYRNLENKDSFINNHNAKQCALIAVDEILKMNIKPLIYEKWWQEVKQEIEKL